VAGAAGEVGGDDAIHYFHSLSSPWAYLGGPGLAEIAARYRVRILCRPITVLTENGGVLLRTRPDARQRYHRINTLLACCAALAGPRDCEGGEPIFVAYNWQDGDERFLPHMFTTGVIGDHQGNLLLTSAPISSQGLAWLKEQADSGNFPPWAKRIPANAMRASEGRQ
jgi:hypothetical protein